MALSLSRQLARFVAGLTYEALPPKVVDKAKACLLHNLAAGFLGFGTPHGQGALRLVKEEEARPNGATILVDGSRATRMGAVFANSAFIHATNQCDSYRMLTHPGPCVVPAVLASAELAGKDGRELLTALVAGYEVQTRLSRDFIPSTQARGYRSAPVYGTLGSAVATGKLLGLSEDQMVNAIALAATSASGTSESARVGGSESSYHEPSAARNGVLAALAAATENHHCAETALEGDAGFYYVFTGNNQGKLSYTFTGPNVTSLDSIVEGLGDYYEMTNVTFKPYPTPGYNNAVIELMTLLKRKHPINPDQVDEITVEMNWLETSYPSPAFPRPELREPRVGTIHYVTAYVCVEGSYPIYGRWYEGGLGRGESGEKGESPKVTELMRKVRVVGSRERSFFAPRITVKMKDGSLHSGEFTGEEFKLGFEQDARRVREAAPGFPISSQQFERVIEALSHLDKLPSVEPLLRHCVASLGER
ncbi:MAG: MmgE/PrpD family protein [Chloroflexi bacterium]|nr:MmgE/PrpD family protein [Chloroflexota bacterium]